MRKTNAGRKPLGDKVLTGAQKMQRVRAKLAFYVEAAKDNDFTSTTVLLSNKQLKSLLKFSLLETKEKNLMDGQKINEAIFYALKAHLKNLEQAYIDRGHPAELVNECVYSDDDCADLNNLMLVEVNAAQLFKDWEKCQQIPHPDK